MPRLDVGPDDRLLVRLLRDPQQLERFSPQEWARALDAAEHARLLGWLLNRIDETVPARNQPQWLTDRFRSAVSTAAEYDRAVRWEIERLHAAFAGSPVSWVLLKGAAYIAAGLPPGRGRRVAD